MSNRVAASTTYSPRRSRSGRTTNSVAAYTDYDERDDDVERARSYAASGSYAESELDSANGLPVRRLERRPSHRVSSPVCASSRRPVRSFLRARARSPIPRAIPPPPPWMTSPTGSDGIVAAPKTDMFGDRVVRRARVNDSRPRLVERRLSVPAVHSSEPPMSL